MTSLRFLKVLGHRRNLLSFKLDSPQFRLVSRCLTSSTGIDSDKNKKSTLFRHLKARIKANGPMTVAEYMKEVLTNPVYGYYMNNDVFGSKGDFTTSPEISQMFGELLGIWCINEYIQSGGLGPLQLVEFGPGRGTLIDDMCRVFSKFNHLKGQICIHLVEVSPTLSGIQASKLSGKDGDVELNKTGEGAWYCRTITKYNQAVYWYRSFQDVPKNKMYYIAHEFFDALPIHKFQKSEKGWQEVLVDVADEDKLEFRFILVDKKTTGLTYLKPDPEDKREHIEVCPEGGALIQQISQRIQEFGGGLLIGDYGHSGDKTDTFRGFKNHELHDALKNPGTADLTADVDFSYLKKMAETVSVKAHGPKTQEKFLHNLGIGVRLQALLQNAQADDWKDLLTGYDMLMNPKKMGERFQFISVVASDKKDYTPAGFENIPESYYKTDPKKKPSS